LQAIEIQKFGMEGLALVDRPEPQPGRGEVLVRIRAVSLNFRDYLTVIGQYNPKYRLPLIPVCDAAGEVVAVGEDVTEWKTGDRVASVFAPKWQSGAPSLDQLRSTVGGPLDGTLTELRVFPDYGLVRIPEYLPDEEAATLSCAGVTAWSALRQGQVTAGDVVVAQGTGGVSIFAMQLAKLMGARVIVTSSSDDKLQRAKDLGADDGINYKEKPNWSKEVRRLTRMRGADHIIEVGGPGTLEQSLRSVRLFGHVSLIGVLAGRSAELDLTPALMQNVRIQGVVVGSRADYAEMLRAMEQHEMRPVVGSVYELKDFRAAFEEMQAGRHFGKIVIKIS